jgi:lipoprotein signal peptidase
MKRKELIILISIVLFDLATKIAANCFLPFNEFVDIIGQTVSLYLTYNEGSTGGQADVMFPPEFNKNLLIILYSINELIILAYSLFIRTKNISLIYKILIGIGLFILLTISISFTYPLFWTATISSWTASVVGKLAALSIWGAIFYFSKAKWVRLFILIILSCGIGNLLNHFYSPYMIIDFLYIEGSYELLRIGVSNFADLAFDIGIIGLILSLIIVFVNKIKNHNRRTPQVEEAINDGKASS